MKTGIFITARLGSTRLPRKHLLAAGNRPMMGVLLQRIERAFRAEVDCGDVVVVITTSDQAEDADFEVFRQDGAEVFHGSLENIPLRHQQAAESLGIGQIVSVDGDDVLCSVSAMRLVREALLSGSPYAMTTSLPLGMNAYGYTVEFLADSLRGKEQQTLENGWLRIFDDAQATPIDLALPQEVPENLRFTLDYPQDQEFFQALAAAFGERILDASDTEIVAHVLEHRLYELTDPISAEYWEYYEGVRAREMDGS